MEYLEECFQLESKFPIYLLIGKNISEIMLKNPGFPKVYVCTYVFVHISTCSPILLKIFMHSQRKKDIYPSSIDNNSGMWHSRDFYTFLFFPHYVFRIHYFNNQRKTHLLKI